MLVALEQERSNPNLATLARIGDAFGVPVTRLVEMTGEPAVRISGPDGARVALARAGRRDRHDHRGHRAALGGGAVALEVQPGEEFGGDAHAPATREMAWVEQGTLTLTVAGEQHQVGPGECARFPGGLPHAYRNDGSAPVPLTMIVVVPPALE